MFKRPKLAPLNVVPPAPLRPGTEFQQLAASTHDQVDTLTAGVARKNAAAASYLEASQAVSSQALSDLDHSLGDMDTLIGQTGSYNPAGHIDGIMTQMSKLSAAAASVDTTLAGDPALNVSTAFPGGPPVFQPPPEPPPAGGGSGAGGGTGGGPAPPPVIPPASSPCPQGFTSSASGSCVPTGGGGTDLPPIIPPILPGAGAGEGGAIGIGAAGTVTTAIGIIIPVAVAFLMFNWAFGTNWDAQMAQFAAYVKHWFEVDPLGAQLYADTQRLQQMQAQLAGFPAGQAARQQLIEAIAREQAVVNADLAAIRQKGIPPLPKG